MHVSNYFYNEPNILLAEELAPHRLLARLLLQLGGEANEALLKLTRRHFYGQGQTGRARIIASTTPFTAHPRAVSMTGTPKYREGFGVPARHPRALRRSRRREKAMGPTWPR